MKMRIKGTDQSFELLEESRAGLGKVLFKGRVTEIPLSHINLIAEPESMSHQECEGERVWIEGVGLVTKAEAQLPALYIKPATTGELYRRKEGSA